MRSVSFIIPIYNCKPYLELCIASLMEAVGDGDEILLVDDGSGDGSAELCDELARQYSQIRVVHQQNSGVSTARNRGIDMARGEYLIFLDADDRVDTEKLKQLLDEIRKSEPCDMVVYGLSFDYYYRGRCYRRDFLRDPKDRVMEPQQWGQELHDLFAKNLISPIWNKVFRRDIMENNHLLLRKDLFLYEDLEFVLRYMSCCETIRNCPDVIYRYRQAEDEGNAKRRLKRVGSLTDLIRIFETAFDDLMERKQFGVETRRDVHQILLEIYLTLLREKAAVTSWQDLPALFAEFGSWEKNVPDEVKNRLSAGSRQYLEDVLQARRAKLVLRERLTSLRHRVAIRVKNTGLYRKVKQG